MVTRRYAGLIVLLVFAVAVAAYTLSNNIMKVPPASDGSTSQTNAATPQKPMNVTLGIITRNTEAAFKYRYIADTTLKDVNAYASAQDSRIRFVYELFEEESSEKALDRIISLDTEEGVKIILGFDDLDMCMSLSYVLTNNILFMGVHLNHCPSSALPDDVMFRIGPNTRLVHQATAALLKEKEIQGVLVIQSASSWGDECKGVLAQSLGEDRVLDVRYYLEASWYAEVANYTEVAIEAGEKVAQLTERFGKEHTAVVLVAGGESSTILREAGGIDGLLGVQWVMLDDTENTYSEDWDPQRPGAFDADQNATAEALSARLIRVNLVNMTDNEAFTELQAGYMSLKPPPEYGRLGLRDACLRDSIWVTCLSVLEGGTTDGGVLKDLVPAVAEGWIGASGQVVFDLNGDRAPFFEYYQLSQAPGSYDWVKIGSYDSLTSKVEMR